MGVQVDEAGQQDLAGGVIDVGIVGDGQVGPDVGDLTVVDQHVDRVTLAVRPYTPNQACSCADRLLIGAHQQVEQHRHPDMHTVGNLLQHSRLRRVGNG